jgi:hypothetical protein
VSVVWDFAHLALSAFAKLRPDVIESGALLVPALQVVVVVAAATRPVARGGRQT